MRNCSARAYYTPYKGCFAVIGVFDSGVGGLASARVLRSRLKAENIIYLADRKNAPYGTKSKEELISLVSNDILRLKNYGCRICLIACCTASSVYEHLDNELKKISLPIIEPAALLASRGRKIAVIATEHTVESSVFKQKIACFFFPPVLIYVTGTSLFHLRNGGTRVQKEVKGS